MADSARPSIQCTMLRGLAGVSPGRERVGRTVGAQEETSGLGQIVPGEGAVPELLWE